MEALVGFAVLFFLLYIVANKNDRNKKKIQQHIDNGDIDPDAFRTPTPDACLRETFRKLANS